MIVAESRRGRRLLGLIENGVELVGAILELCGQRRVRSGEVRAVGTLGAVELRTFDPIRRAWGQVRRFETPSTIVQLQGHIAQLDGHTHLFASCAVARAGDNGIEVIGGYLVRAEAYAVEFVVEAYEDVLLQRSMETGGGMALWRTAVPQADEGAEAAEQARAAVDAPRPAAPENEPERQREKEPALTESSATRAAPLWTIPVPSASLLPSATPPSVKSAPAPEPAGPQWGDVIVASQQKGRGAGEPDDEEPGPRPGDSIDHPKFGRCDIERIEGDHEFAQVRLRNGRLVRLSLDVLQLERVSQEGPRRHFRARTSR